MEEIISRLQDYLKDAKEGVPMDYPILILCMEKVEALAKQITNECNKQIKVELDLTLDELDKMTGEKKWTKNY